MTVYEPKPPYQLQDMRIQQILCGVALLLFATFYWSRALHWSTETITHVEVIGGQGFKLVTDGRFAFDGSEWDLLSDLTRLLGVLLVAANLAFLFGRRSVDQIVPAITNSGIGALLTALCLYFILDPMAAMNSAPRRGMLAFQWELGSSVYSALVLTVALLGIGLAQGFVRQRAIAADPA